MIDSETTIALSTKKAQRDDQCAARLIWLIVSPMKLEDPQRDDHRRGDERGHDEAGAQTQRQKSITASTMIDGLHDALDEVVDLLLDLEWLVVGQLEIDAVWITRGQLVEEPFYTHRAPSSTRLWSSAMFTANVRAVRPLVVTSPFGGST